jgi:hypothetical protein
MKVVDIIFIVFGLLFIGVGVIGIVYKPSEEQKTKKLFKNNNLKIIGGISIVIGVISLMFSMYLEKTDSTASTASTSFGFRFY